MWRARLNSFYLEETGQTESAIEHLRKGAKLASNYSPVREHLGLAYAKEGRHRDAVKSFERATKINPGYKLAWEHLPSEYQAIGRSMMRNPPPIATHA